jgi:hypothetical protein
MWMRILRDTFDTLTRVPLAIVLANLPRRWWPRLEDWAPVSAAALASAVVTMLVAMAIGIPGYFDFLPRTLRIPGPLAPFWFAFTTPVGLVATYLFVTGFLRTAGALVDDVRGDPVLTAIDAWAIRRAQDGRDERQRQQREALEGPDVPDRLVEGRAAGFPDADWVVIAARRKPEWTKGTFVVTADKWYRLLEPVERQMPVGLRTLYPLSEIRDLEAMRRRVDYELPPVSRRGALENRH